MSSRHFYHFSALPMSMRMVYGLDGNPGSVSAQDIRTAYHGSESDTRLETALKGPMADMLPPEERNVIFSWVKDGAKEAGYAEKVKPIVESRCLACHDGSNPHLPRLTSYEKIGKLTQKDEGATIPTLVRVSHIHLFGITFIFFIVSSIFAHAYMKPLWLKCAVIVLPFLTIITDIFSWYLTKMFPGFAWFIIISGVLMGISFAVQWVVSMWQMWFYTLPDDIQECGGALPVIRRKLNTDDV
ncbi:MAG: MFS transporter [Thiobacillus sp.]|nr:MFS transporter [Thiobacillus sp.]